MSVQDKAVALNTKYVIAEKETKNEKKMPVVKMVILTAI
jgi:hypothetical protein